MAYWPPNEGTNLWSDAMVIPANAKCPKLANEFINYILTDDASYDNSSTVGYASSNKNVLEEMSAPGGGIRRESGISAARRLCQG